MNDFWKGRRIFVTGHTGFKGSWLCLWLRALGAEVGGYALDPPTTPSLFELARIGQGMTSVVGDVRDAEAIGAAIEHFQPEIVFHLAAQSLVGQSYSDPGYTFEVNVMGTVRVLDAVRQCKSVRAVVIVTSDKCYDNKEWAWGYREDEPMGGADPYSSSKGCTELVVAAYRRSFFSETGVAVATVRAGNVVGGGDWADARLVPDVLRAIIEKRPVSIRYPNAIRPWQHVLEPLSGYMLLAQRLLEGEGRYAEAWNFGPSDEDCRPVAWVAERLMKLWGDDLVWQPVHRQPLHEASFLKLDSSKARLRLNWHPCWSVTEALHAVVEWHKCYLDGNDVEPLMLRQIERYSWARGLSHVDEN